MNKKEQEQPEEILTEIGGRPAKLILGDPTEQKRVAKLSSMRIALTYIEGQGMTKVSPKKAIKIADEFLEWLEEK